MSQGPTGKLSTNAPITLGKHLGGVRPAHVETNVVYGTPL